MNAKTESRYLALLSGVLLENDVTGSSHLATDEEGDGIVLLAKAIASFGREEFGELWTLATSNHVILRAFPHFGRALEAEGGVRAEWMDKVIDHEQGRVQHALSFLAPICQALGQLGDVIVIKSLDHWPDLGSDLVLCTNADAHEVVAVMRERFHAQLAERSWGDRLADKWNFIVPGLPELVEVHVARLGQTGEQIAITQSLIARSGMEQFGDSTFRVPAPEDRMIVSTLQRMYRHFYIRLCDIVDNAKLIDSETVSYEYLHSLAEPAGLWEGLATYLVIVSEYVEFYRGKGLPLPELVTGAARFGNGQVRLKRKFLRVPIFPHAIGLYLSELKGLLLSGELQNTLRLSLLPGLATAAALELKLTGSDKGIW